MKKTAETKATTEKSKKPSVIKDRVSNIRLPRIKTRKKTIEERVSDALKVVPKITNETLSSHREEVLSNARKYIYPLKHSKRSVVKNSIIILVSVVILFIAACVVDLYKFQDTSGFIYTVTEILPFPVAKEGHEYILYKNYLFELRRFMHYYQTQQGANFSTKSGKAQLMRLKQESMNEAILDSYVARLAKTNHVRVTNAQVNSEVNLLISENRLGNGTGDLKDVLNQFYGWDEDDFKQELKQQLLQQAVVSKLDTSVLNTAQSVLAQLQKGADFATLAEQYSDDVSTKASGGAYPGSITINDSSISPIITEELFKLKPNQISGIVNTGYTLEILKVISNNGNSVQASHIEFDFNSINTYTNPLAKKYPAHSYIKI